MAFDPEKPLVPSYGRSNTNTAEADASGGKEAGESPEPEATEKPTQNGGGEEEVGGNEVDEGVTIDGRPAWYDKIFYKMFITLKEK